MDLIDKKILNELINNSRNNISQISKKVRLSRENTTYRIKKLEEKGIIKEYIANINYKSVGFQQSSIFVEFSKITKEKEYELIRFLKQKEQISWIGLLMGKWNLTFDIFTRNDEEIDSFLMKFLNKFENNIENYIILKIKEARYFFNKIVGNKTKKVFNNKKEKQSVEKDVKNILILKELNNNPKIKYTEIAEKLKLTPNAIKKRIKQLEENKIIEQYTVSINLHKFNLEWHGLQIKLTKPTKKTETKLKIHLQFEDKVIFYYQYYKTGTYDFDVGIAVKNPSELRDFINKLREEFAEEIKIINKFIVLEEESSQKIAKNVFNNQNV